MQSFCCVPAHPHPTPWGLFYNCTNPIHESDTLWPITYQRHHPLNLSHWGLGFNIGIWGGRGGHKHSVHSSSYKHSLMSGLVSSGIHAWIWASYLESGTVVPMARARLERGWVPALPLVCCETICVSGSHLKKELRKFLRLLWGSTNSKLLRHFGEQAPWTHSHHSLGLPLSLCCCWLISPRVLLHLLIQWTFTKCFWGVIVSLH